MDVNKPARAAMYCGRVLLLLMFITVMSAIMEV